MEQLNNEQVGGLLSGMDGWTLSHDPRQKDQPDAIFKSINCPAFTEGMTLADRAARALSGAEDHFGVSVYGFQARTQVTFLLRTINEAKDTPVFGVTHRDVALAKAIDLLLTPGA